MHPINFVFDIDDTLGVHFDEKNLERATAIIKELYGQEFLEKHLLTAADYPHFIFPGIPELLKYLHDLGHNISIFSSGAKIRNDEFVDKLTILAFGDQAPKIRKEINVFSREDCFCTTYLSNRDDYQPCFHGNYKKILADKVVPASQMPWTLLIDDDSSYMAKNEEYNFIKVAYSYLSCTLTQDDFCSYACIYKAFFLVGLFDAIFKRVEETNCTAVEAAKYIQIDCAKEEFDWHFYYKHTIGDIDLYRKGEAILSDIYSDAKIPPQIMKKMIVDAIRF